MVAPKKVWTYNKYKTILSTLSKVVFERLDTKYLPLSKLRDLETIRQITLGFEVIFQEHGSNPLQGLLQGWGLSTKKGTRSIP